MTWHGMALHDMTRDSMAHDIVKLSRFENMGFVIYDPCFFFFFSLLVRSVLNM